jgi:hypothetical protein
MIITIATGRLKGRSSPQNKNHPISPQRSLMSPAPTGRAVRRRAIASLVVLSMSAGCSDQGDDVARYVTEIHVSPSSMILRPGQSGTFTALGVYADGRSVDVTSRVAWISREETVAAITISSEKTATLTASSPGVTSVRARLGKLDGFALVGVSVRTETPRSLAVDPKKPRYFVDSSGRPVYLAGSHTWTNFQDSGPAFPPPAFDYTRYLDFLQRHNHNFFRLWTLEQGNWVTDATGNYWFDPMPYQRTGPGNAIDGMRKFDLTKFNEAYFERLRHRVAAAGERGIFVSVMLFDGWSVETRGRMLNNPWRGHPFHRANNINGIDGDPNGDEAGIEVHRLIDSGVLKIQEAYIRKVIDTLSNLHNVLYEISNESRGGSAPWQHHMIEYIKRYQAKLSIHHPVGMTVERPGESHAALFESAADWVSPWRFSNNPLEPLPSFAQKVIVNDTDHLCGVCGTMPWVWKSLTAGLNPILMDPYDLQAVGLGALDDTTTTQREWDLVRRNLGYSRVFAELLDLKEVEPLGALASSGYCMASPLSERPEYLIFAPGGRPVQVDLSTVDRPLTVEWFDPLTGRLEQGQGVAGGAPRSFRTPFAGDSILYLKAAPRLSLTK